MLANLSQVSFILYSSPVTQAAKETKVVKVVMALG